MAYTLKVFPKACYVKFYKKLTKNEEVVLNDLTTKMTEMKDEVSLYVFDFSVTERIEHKCIRALIMALAVARKKAPSKQVVVVEPTNKIMREFMLDNAIIRFNEMSKGRNNLERTIQEASQVMMKSFT